MTRRVDSAGEAILDADVWHYIRATFPQPDIQEGLAILAEQCPGVLNSYFHMRQAIFIGPPDPALSEKVRELVVLAIETIAGRKNPPPVLHARKAVAAGASLQEIAEVMSLCIMLGGMITYQESGQFVMLAARDALKDKDQA